MGGLNKLGIKVSGSLVLVLMFTVLLTSCSGFAKNAPKAYETQDFLMGTVITQTVYGENAELAAAEVSRRLREIENRMTINAPGGEVNQLNDMAGKGEVKLQNDTFQVLKKAVEYAKLSGGMFDVTIGPLVKSWGVFTDNPRIPPQDEIDELLKLVDYTALHLDDDRLIARLEKSGQIVDLGAIAKGYGGDETVRIYKQHGIKSAYVFLGGNVVVLGTKPDGKLWRIGIQNPRAENGKYIGIVEAADKSIVTSGDYERFFIDENKRYHHIIDPKTGYPSSSGLISTTIVSDLSIDADALSTTTFVLGLEKGMELIEKLDGVEAIFVTDDKNIYVTDGLADNFEFIDESKEFNYVKKG